MDTVVDKHLEKVFFAWTCSLLNLQLSKNNLMCKRK